MANGSAANKASKARSKADDAKYMWGDSERLANKIAKTATGKSLTMDEQSRAGKIIQNRRMNDTARTANRAEFIARRTAKNEAADRMNAAVGGGTSKKQTPKATTKKAVAKKAAPAKKAVDKKYPGLYKKSK
jgi:3-phenylpropionate/cinnamic acid dioxygenase small subunit